MSADNTIRSINIISEKDQNLIESAVSNLVSKTVFDLERILSYNFSIDITMDQDIVKGYSQDWSNINGSAEALCRPKDKVECAVIMKTCSMLKIPMTISAGRTNLTGSATPDGGIIISISKINNIGYLNIDEKIIECEPGVYLEELREHVTESSNNQLIFPVDPTSRKEAMVGGAISCNASGFTPGEKGAMRYWVDGFELILPNGELIKTNRGDHVSKDGFFTLRFSNGTKKIIEVPKYNRVNIKNASGPFSSSDGKIDLVDLIVGSEGIFGCIYNSYLKLQNMPSDYLNLFIKLSNQRDAFLLYDDISDQLSSDMSSLSGFEYFGENCSDYMTNKDYLLDKDYTVGVYIQIPIYKSEIDDVVERWYNILMDLNYINDDDQIISLNDIRNWKIFFDARHSIPANALQKSKQYKTASIITDTIVPPASFVEFIDKTQLLIREKNIEYLLFGHLGDCHLHFHLIPNKQNENTAIKCYREIIKLSSSLGGVYSAEHGTGKRKKQDFLECFGEEAAKQVKKCKKGFDPYFLLNRGNVIN